MSTHTSKVYEHELRTLREKVLLMGSLAEEMIQKAVLAQVNKDFPEWTAYIQQIQAVK
mgnify:CR=1 FL=1